MQGTKQFRSKLVSIDPHHIIIALTCGGAAGILPRNPNNVADIIVCADAQDALQDIPENVFKIVLSGSETTGTICDKVTRRHHEYERAAELLKNQNTSLDMGFAQIPRLCEMSILLHKKDIEQILREVVNEAIILSAGALKRVTLMVFSSNSGGTGSAAAFLLGTQLSTMLLAETDATVEVQHFRVGGMTYKGLGEHTQTNNAAGVIRDLAYILAPGVSGREIRTLQQLELPMDGTDGVLRDKHMLAAALSMMSPETRLALSVERPNIQGNEKLGRIDTRHLGYWILPSAVNVDATAAMLLQNDLDQMLLDGSQTNAPMVNSPVTHRVTKANQYDSLLALVKRSSSRRPANVGTFLVTGIYTNCQVTVRKMSADVSRPVRYVLSVMTPKTASEFAELLRDLRALKAALLSDKATAEKSAKARRTEYDERLKKVNEQLDARWPGRVTNWPTFVAMFRSYWTNPVKVGIELGKLLPNLAKAEIEYLREDGRVGSINEAIVAVDKQYEILINYLRKMQTWLKTIASEAGARADLFIAGGIENVFPYFIDAAMKDSMTEFRTACAKGINAVSMEGLALICGSPEASPIAIVHKLMENPGETPWPGGLVREDNNKHTVIVIPQVGNDVLDALQVAAGEANANFDIARIGGVDGVIAIVRLDVYKVLTLNDVWTNQTNAALQRLLNNDDLMELTRVTSGAPFIDELNAAMTSLHLVRED